MSSSSTTGQDGRADGSVPGRRTPGRPVKTVGVTVMFLLAGLLFGTSASLARERPPVGSVSDLPGLITARDSQVRELTQQAEGLRDEVSTLQAAVDTSQTRQLTRAADALAPAVGLGPVEGPAVQVTLDDAGYSLDTLPEGYSVDDVVVHQQDLQGVMNALWAGGAEAMMVQDQRVISTSSVQCVGNTLYLQGRVYSPPYTVTAIGDPAAMLSALEDDPTVSTYRDWAELIGLGYTATELGRMEMPAYAGSLRPQHATPVVVPAEAEEIESRND
ncbi:DUF881 domain-containing protein [Ornithinimicrobium sp. W1665]|uniref:DUF881 domain-containing protein n=1 Tax=Ornithinimicrobium sp. W1665 TaxID=3416666 RepID=UPI003CE89683